MDGQDQVQSGAGYGDGGMNSGSEGSQVPAQSGGMDSSGGLGGTGEQQDQSVQRSETVEAEDLDAEDIEFEADADLIDDDDA